MNRKKERKLRRMRKQKIWPHVLGLILMVLIYVIMIGAVAAAFGVNVISRNVQNEFRNLRRILEAFEQQWEGENSEDTQELYENISRIVPSVEDICILDEGGKSIHSYGGDKPNLDFPDIDLHMERGNVKIYLVEDTNSLVSVKDNQIYINEAQLRPEVLFSTNMDTMAILDSRAFTRMKLWYVVPFEEKAGSLCIKSEIIIEELEITVFAAMLLIVSFLAAIIFLYHLIAMISLVLEKRKVLLILHTDTMTGGSNLTYFHTMAGRYLKKKRRANYAVVSLGMEKYTNYCAYYGIRTGEELVDCFWEVLKKAVSGKELAAHVEQGEFALLMKFRSETELEKRLTNIRESLEDIRPDQNVCFSIGIYHAEAGAWDSGRMLNWADMARSQITQGSTVRIRWFDEELQRQQSWNRLVEDDMERALKNREFQIYLQPKYNTKGERLAGAEALVRWLHPVEGFVAPYRFIPLFEENGFIRELDDYMIREVARQQAAWIAQGHPVVPVSVNISRASFSREDLAEHICSLVDQFRVPHEIIELELTESAFFDDKDVLLQTLRKLKEYGFTLSMDDFGAGYSSLNSLKELPLDVVKLDAEFFRNTDKAGRSEVIVGDTIALAKKLNMRIVAEGIETREQVDFLAENNCDLIQGYYFAKPMPIQEFEENYFSE